MSEEECWYRVIPASKVRPEIVEAARRACRFAERDLGLEPLKITWIISEDVTYAKLDIALDRFGRVAPEERLCLSLKYEFWGRTAWRGKEVRFWIRADIPLAEIVRVVLHEARHVKQGPTLNTPEIVKWAESDAEAYAQRHYRRVTL